MKKVSKASVNYRMAGESAHNPYDQGDRNCGHCSMYRKDTALEGRCTLVAGSIRTDYTCDEWEARK